MTSHTATLPANARVARRPVTDDLRLAAWQVLYEQRAFWRNRARACFILGLPLVFLVLFTTLNHGEKVASRGGIPYADVFVPGILAYAMIMASFTNLAIETARQRDAGVLKRVQGTPLPGWAYLVGRAGSAMVASLAMAAIMLTLAVVAYGLHVRVEALPSMVVALLAGTATFTALGLGVARFIPNADAAPAIVNLLLLPLTFISGVWGPVDDEPEVLRRVADWFPLQHLVAALQHCFDPRVTGAAFSGHDLLVLGIWLVAGARLTQVFRRRMMRG